MQLMAVDGFTDAAKGSGELIPRPGVRSMAPVN